MKKMSKALIARIKFRYDGYYESKSKAKVRENAMKMAHNWAHEYPTGTPLLYIRDDIIACWERNGKVTRKDAETATSNSKETVHNYVEKGLPELHGK